MFTHISPSALEIMKIIYLLQVYQTIEKNEMRLEDQDKKDAIKNEWQQLALVIDRLLLFIFIIITTGISLALILPGYYAQMDDIV